MKRFIFILTILALPFVDFHDAIGVNTSRTKAISKYNSKSYVPGEIIVKFKKNVSEKAKLSIHSKKGAERIKGIPLINAELIKVKDDQYFNEVLKRYQQDPDVEYAEPNYIKYKKSIVPDDPYFGSQWGLHNTGQMVNGVIGTPGADISIIDAWNITTGSSQVIIAILDDGIDYNHPDLSGNIWTNTGETSCADGVDNDDNGYIDDCHGYDFGEDDNDPMGLYSHGTFVAGIIGAASNSIGIAGVMHIVHIMPIRFFNDSDEGNIAAEISGIGYAVANGAKIINMSFVGDDYTNSEYDAISAAKDAGVLVVASAENLPHNMDNYPTYPCNFDLSNIICVTATDQNDNIAS